MIANTIIVADWGKEIAIPCPPGDEGDWEGPKEFKICRDTLPEWDQANWPCPGCCITFTFYDRWGGDEENNYEMFMSAMYYGPDESCITCAQSPFRWHWFLRLYLRYKAINEPNFKSRVLSSDRIIEDEFYDVRYIYYFSKARCVNQEEEDCDTEQYCCRHIGYLGWIDDGKPDHYLDSWETDLDVFTMVPECPQNCNERCFKEPLGSDFCDMPCNYGEWDEEVSEDVIYTTYCGIEQCTIKVNYFKREVYCNDITYYDYYLHSLKLEGCDDCDYNNQDYNNFLAMAYQWLLLNGEHPKPPDLYQTWSNYRVVSALCWDKIEVEGNHYLQQCQETFCCWGLYSITKVGANQWETSRLTGSQNYNNCEEYQDCFTYCDAFPVIYYSTAKESIDKIKCNFNTFVKPNPTNDGVDFSISSKETGLLNLVIYDTNGKLI